MSAINPPLAPAPPKTAADWRAPLVLAWFGAATPLILLAMAALSLTPDRDLADLLLGEQDLPAVLVIAAFLIALRFAPLSRLAWGERTLAVLTARARPLTAALAVFAGVAAVAGWFLVLRGYALSMDEAMAGFDTAIFQRGLPAAPIAEAWRAYAFPLQPQFILNGPDHAYWVSAYLPASAAIRALFAALGASWLVNALWAVLAVAATYGVGRRLWPDRPDAAAVAAVLLATSSQFLLTAMTPYAAAAHLALNMSWLWLFLRGDRRGDAAALGVGLVAAGLHQIVFHPLFAAPFIAGLWLGRRWRRAALYTAGYAVICLAWLLYRQATLPGAALVAIGGSMPNTGIVAKVMDLAAHLTPAAVRYMAMNLVRFLSWQNPLLIALAVMAAGAAARRQPVLRAMLAGFALTLIVAALLMPYQGHGWGYRYVHGFLGGAALLAAYGWIGLTEAATPERRRAVGAAFALAALFSVACLLPLRAVQARTMVGPYARADRAIDALDAEVALIDFSGLFYASDLVRNDPWLIHGPKRMDLGVMTDAEIAEVCGRFKVRVFGPADGLALGIDPAADPSIPHAIEQRKLLKRIGCGS